MLDRPSSHADTARRAAAAPLLMLPGTLCDARVFAPVLDELGLAAIVPELGGASTAAELAAKIIPTMPARISLVGFSLGAVVAFEIIAQAPDQVERLALIGGNAGMLPAELQATRRTARRDSFVGAGEPRMAHLMAADISDAHWRDQTAITLDRNDSRPRLAAIAVPVLALCGADDRICPPAMSREIVAGIPGARLALIAGAGHYVTLEQPAAVAAEIAAWLATPNPLM